MGFGAWDIRVIVISIYLIQGFHRGLSRGVIQVVEGTCMDELSHYGESTCKHMESAMDTGIM